MLETLWGLSKGPECGETPLCLTALFPWASLSSLSLPLLTQLHPEMTRLYHCHAWRCALSVGSALLLKAMDTGGNASLSWLFSQDSLTHQPAFSAFGYFFFLVGCGSRSWSLSFLDLVKEMSRFACQREGSREYPDPPQVVSESLHRHCPASFLSFSSALSCNCIPGRPEQTSEGRYGQCGSSPGHCRTMPARGSSPS